MWGAGAGIALSAVLLAVAQPAALPLWLTYAAILALGWWLPGLLLALLWDLPQIELPAFLLVAFGLGLAWLMAGSLLLHYVPGPIPVWTIPVVYGGGAAALLAATALRSPRLPRAGDAQTWRWALALLALAALLRLWVPC